RIRLLGSRSVHARTNSALLRTAIERRARCLPARRPSPITHKLVKRRHESPLRQVKKRYGTNPIWLGFVQESRKATGTRSQQRGLLLRTGPCSSRRNRWNLGTSPPAGPAYRRVVAQEQKACSRETLR